MSKIKVLFVCVALLAGCQDPVEKAQECVRACAAAGQVVRFFNPQLGGHCMCKPAMECR